MKIILAGVFNVPWSTSLFMKKHLEKLGHQVFPFEIDRAHPAPLGPAGRLLFGLGTRMALRAPEQRLLALTGEIRPDAVVVMKGRRLDPECTRQLARKTMVVYRYMDGLLHPYVTGHARASRAVFVTGEHLVAPLARETGRDNVFHLLEGCDPEIHCPGSFDPEYACDLAFVGAPAPDRVEYLRACLRAGYSVRVWGQSGWPRGLGYTGRFAHLGELGTVCASAKIVLGINSLNDRRGYFSDRNILVPACGGFMLTHYVPGLERYFEQGRHLAWYRDRGQLLELMKHYLINDEERKKISEGGRKHVLSNYTWDISMRRMLSVLEDLRV
jgi:glycosyltransferase involved in cell wall biosynthesis